VAPAARSRGHFFGRLPGATDLAILPGTGIEARPIPSRDPRLHSQRRPPEANSYQPPSRPGPEKDIEETAPGGAFSEETHRLGNTELTRAKKERSLRLQAEQLGFALTPVVGDVS
jgi:hypothetical protein